MITVDYIGGGGGADKTPKLITLYLNSPSDSRSQQRKKYVKNNQIRSKIVWYGGVALCWWLEVLIRVVGGVSTNSLAIKNIIFFSISCIFDLECTRCTRWPKWIFVKKKLRFSDPVLQDSSHKHHYNAFLKVTYSFFYCTKILYDHERKAKSIWSKLSC